MSVVRLNIKYCLNNFNLTNVELNIGLIYFISVGLSVGLVKTANCRKCPHERFGQSADCPTCSGVSGRIDTAVISVQFNFNILFNYNCIMIVVLLYGLWDTLSTRDSNFYVTESCYNCFEAVNGRLIKSPELIV
jgi:hypothetical protein